MAKKVILKIKNANKIFSVNYTKINREDIIGIIHDKKRYLSQKDSTKLQNLIDNKKYGSHEYYVKRNGNTVTFIPFDN